MSYEKLLEFVGIENPAEQSKLIDGNILSGTAQCDETISVSLSTNTILYEKNDILEDLKEYPCISCGKCAAVCPVFLNPQRLDQLYLSENYEDLVKNNLHSCIECGCCSYICPARRYLMQRIVAGKAYDKKNRGLE